MPIFKEFGGTLQPLTAIQPGEQLYEQEIEELLWSNFEAFFASDLFPVCRQRAVVGGGIPDVIALDEQGRVVVFEVKRSIERSQLAQCLEYAGWARRTNLDELAALYHRSNDDFFADWIEFTNTTAPILVNPDPQLVLVAAEFDERTQDALAFLEDNGLPVYAVPVGVYQDDAGARFYAIESDFDDTGLTATPKRRSPIIYTYQGRRLQVADLLAAGYVRPGEPLRLLLPRAGIDRQAEILPDGQIRTDDGVVHPSLSRAAAHAGDRIAAPGWSYWTCPERAGQSMAELRAAFLASHVEAGGGQA